MAKGKKNKGSGKRPQGKPAGPKPEASTAADAPPAPAQAAPTAPSNVGSETPLNSQAVAAARAAISETQNVDVTQSDRDAVEPVTVTEPAGIEVPIAGPLDQGNVTALIAPEPVELKAENPSSYPKQVDEVLSVTHASPSPVVPEIPAVAIEEPSSIATPHVPETPEVPIEKISTPQTVKVPAQGKPVVSVPEPMTSVDQATDIPFKERPEAANGGETDTTKPDLTEFREPERGAEQEEPGFLEKVLETTVSPVKESLSGVSQPAASEPNFFDEIDSTDEQPKDQGSEPALVEQIALETVAASHVVAPHVAAPEPPVAEDDAFFEQVSEPIDPAAAKNTEEEDTDFFEKVGLDEPVKPSEPESVFAAANEVQAEMFEAEPVPISVADGESVFRPVDEVPVSHVGAQESFFEELSEPALRSEAPEESFFEKIGEEEELTPANHGSLSHKPSVLKLDFDDDFLDDEPEPELDIAPQLEQNAEPKAAPKQGAETVTSLAFLNDDDELLSDEEIDFAASLSQNPTQSQTDKAATVSAGGADVSEPGRPKLRSAQSISVFRTDQSGFDLPMEIIPKRRPARAVVASQYVPPSPALPDVPPKAPTAPPMQYQGAYPSKSNPQQRPVNPYQAAAANQKPAAPVVPVVPRPPTQELFPPPTNSAIPNTNGEGSSGNKDDERLSLPPPVNPYAPSGSPRRSISGSSRYTPVSSASPSSAQHPQHPQYPQHPQHMQAPLVSAPAPQGPFSQRPSSVAAPGYAGGPSVPGAPPVTAKSSYTRPKDPDPYGFPGAQPSRNKRAPRVGSVPGKSSVQGTQAPSRPPGPSERGFNSLPQQPVPTFQQYPSDASQGSYNIEHHQPHFGFPPPQTMPPVQLTQQGQYGEAQYGHGQHRQDQYGQGQYQGQYAAPLGPQGPRGQASMPQIVKQASMDPRSSPGYGGPPTGPPSQRGQGQYTPGPGASFPIDRTQEERAATAPHEGQYGEYGRQEEYRQAGPPQAPPQSGPQGFTGISPRTQPPQRDGQFDELEDLEAPRYGAFEEHEEHEEFAQDRERTNAPYESEPPLGQSQPPPKQAQLQSPMAPPVASFRKDPLPRPASNPYAPSAPVSGPVVTASAPTTAFSSPKRSATTTGTATNTVLEAGEEPARATGKYSRPSSTAPSSKYAIDSTAGPSQGPKSTTRSPADVHQDKLRRQLPIFSWSSRSYVSLVPPQISYGSASMGLRIQVKDIKDLQLLGPEKIVSKYPGPLVSSKGPIKGKKKELEKWLQEKLAAEPAPRMHLLWRVMEVLLKQESAETENSQLRRIFSPDQGIPRADRPLSSGADLYARASANENPNGHARQASQQLKGIFEDLLVGDRDSALQTALDNREWAHALIIAQSLGSGRVDSVIKEFVRDQIRSQGTPSGDQLAFLYRVFGGAGADAVDEINPLRKSGLTQTVDIAGLDINLKSWQRYLGLVLANRSPNDAKALLKLGTLLVSRGMVEAGHICMILSGESVFGTPDGLLLPGASDTLGRDYDSILLAEVYEFILLSRKEALVPFVHLVPFKAALGMLLADAGYTAEAAKHADASLQLARMLKAVPLIELCELANQRASISEPSDGSYWISRKLSRPKLDKMWVSSFNKFVSGEDVSEAAEQPPPLRLQGSAPGVGHASAPDLFAPIRGESRPGSVGPGPGPGPSPYYGESVPVRAPSRPSIPSNPYGEQPGPHHGSQYGPQYGAQPSYDSPYGAPNALNGETAQGQFGGPGQGYGHAHGSSNGSSQGSGSVYSTSAVPSRHTTPGGDYPSAPYLGSVQDTRRATAPQIGVDEGPGYDASRARARAPMPMGTPSNPYAPPASQPPTQGPSQSQYQPQPPAEEDDGEVEDLGFGNAKASTNREESEDDNKNKKGEKDKGKSKGKADNADAKDDGTPKKGWFGWLRKSDDPNAPKAIKAKLGEQSSFYYDEELKRWVNKDADSETGASSGPPPPPKMKSAPSPAMAGTPASGPPSRGSTGPPTAPPTGPPMGASTGPPSRAQTGPPMGAPPSAPSASAPGSMRQAPRDDLESLLSSAPATTRTKKRPVRNRYIDVMGQDNK